MKPSIARQLIGINRSFYNDFAKSWTTSRVTIHPGIVRSASSLGSLGHILDLGCGDGRVGRWAQDQFEQLAPKSYLGADFSEGLLSHAKDKGIEFSFVCADLCQAGWSNEIIKYRSCFDSIVCFSALHHIPGQDKRLEFIKEVRSLLADKGSLVVSVWQLSHVPRLKKKIIPWSTLNLPPSEFEANDLLVDWKMGGHGYRYVHEFSENELKELLSEAGLNIIDCFRSDGQTGDMGLYVVAKKDPSSRE